jgi:hypothetical protein
MNIPVWSDIFVCMCMESKIGLNVLDENIFVMSITNYIFQNKNKMCAVYSLIGFDLCVLYFVFVMNF